MGLSGLSGIRGLSGVVPQGMVTGIDPDALAFLSAAGISDSVQRSAIDDLVKGLKANGTWSKYKAIYPMVGGSTNSHKYNLKDPRDLDAAYRLAWVGSINHGPYGIQANGGYADTFYTGACETLSVYTPSNAAIGDMAAGVRTASGTRYLIHPRWTDNYSYFDGADAVSTRIAVGILGALGYLGFSHKPNVKTYAYRNSGVIGDLGARPEANPTGISLYLSAWNDNGIPGFQSTRIYSFFTIANYLTPSETAADYAVIQAYQTALGRAV